MNELSQSSGQLTGTLNNTRDVLARFRVTLTTNTQGPGSIQAPYYIATYTKELEFLNTEALRPRVEVWAALEESTAPFTAFRKCPFTSNEAGTKNISRNVNVNIQEGTSKTTGFNLNVVISYFSKDVGAMATFFVTVYNDSIASTDGSLYPNEGSFS